MVVVLIVVVVGEVGVALLLLLLSWSPVGGVYGVVGMGERDIC